LHEPKNLEQHNMILHPDEQKSLEIIDSTLGAGEPHLAGMFSIFTRLTAEDGIPPDEDRITVFCPAAELPRRRRSVSARMLGRPGRDHRRLGLLASRPLRLVLIPAALLVMLGLIVYASVTSSARCVAGRPARATAAADYSPAGQACPVTRAAPPPGTSSR
jgi:hypothetical protein